MVVPQQHTTASRLPFRSNSATVVNILNGKSWCGPDTLSRLELALDAVLWGVSPPIAASNGPVRHFWGYDFFSLCTLRLSGSDQANGPALRASGLSPRLMIGLRCATLPYCSVVCPVLPAIPAGIVAVRWF